MDINNQRMTKIINTKPNIDRMSINFESPLFAARQTAVKSRKKVGSSSLLRKAVEQAFIRKYPFSKTF
jgi:hypothetical protein